MTQCDRLLKHLKTKSITQVEAAQTLGIQRLAARILDLREKGHDIVTTIMKVSNRYGEVCKIARYRLVKNKK